MSYNMKFGKLPRLASLQTKLIDATVFPSVRILYCPFFLLHGSLRIISCTDLVQNCYGVAWFGKQIRLRGCAKSNFNKFQSKFG